MKRLLLLLFVVLFAVACKKDKTAVKSTTTTTDTTKTLPHVVLNIPAESIKLNPFGNAPLSAIINYTTSVPGHTKIEVEGRDGIGSEITQEFADAGLTHNIPVLGLYANWDNIIDLSFLDSQGNVLAEAKLHIRTAALPVNTPTSITVDNADRAKMEPGFNLVSSFSGLPNPPQTPYILDSYGRIRWYLDFSKNNDLKGLFYDCGIARLKNGNLYFADASSGKIYEVDMMGKIINSWSFPGYNFHHNVFEKPNGNFLISVSKNGSTHTNGSPTVEDFILEIDRTSGKILNEWDLRESLNEYRQTLSNDSQDWIHVNAVIYDPSDNTIIISGRVQGVFKLSYDNHVQWIMGPHVGWGQNRRGEDLNNFLLTPLDAAGNKITDADVLNGNKNSPDFEWNWYQHCPTIMPNGDLMLFDNGATRNFNGSQPSYTRAVEFKINQANKTVQQIWEYGKERGQETFSSIVSSVFYMPGTNHILFSPGFGVQNAGGNGGKMVEVDYTTKKVVFQTSVNNANGWGWHRVYRIPLYFNNNGY
ncbi:MAG: hypothetical protein JWR50_228 [Mucilaginibacter sp.]|nr:hypothetical protein [Mucilaginibacter sp.]